MIKHGDDLGREVLLSGPHDHISPHLTTPYLWIPLGPPGPKEDQGVLSIQILPEETHHLADVQSASRLQAT